MYVLVWFFYSKYNTSVSDVVSRPIKYTNHILIVRRLTCQAWLSSENSTRLEIGMLCSIEKHVRSHAGKLLSQK